MNMPQKNTSAATLDHATVEGSPSTGVADRQPVQIIVAGRGRVGKTSVVNTLVQYFRPRNPRLQVWNSDGYNETNSISRFMPDAKTPQHHDLDDLKAWYEERMQEQVTERFDAVLDVGGNDPLIKNMAHEVRLVTTLRRLGVRLVAAHVFGPDKADLDYLDQTMRDNLFVPEATLLVPNLGLVQTTRSAESAFDPVVTHPTVLAAIGKGAKLVAFPALACMSAVAERRLTFSDVVAGKQADGHPRLSFFDQTRVSIWWEEEIPALISQIPREWRPLGVDSHE
jgi:hypothetical protein